MLPESARKVSSIEMLNHQIKSNKLYVILHGGAETPDTAEGVEIMKTLKANCKDYLVANSSNFDETLTNHIKATF